MELKDQLSALEDSIKADNKEMIEKSLETITNDFGSKLADSSEEVKQMVKDLVKEGDDALSTKFNEFSAKLNEKIATKAKKEGNYTDDMKTFIKENLEGISKVTKGRSVNFGKTEMKAVADMLTTGDHVTGDYIRDYNRSVIELPSQAINVADLIPSITIDGGTYTYIRETAGEGAVAAQTEGSDKAQVDFDYSHIDLSTNFIAGRTIYSKKMKNNLQYLQSVLPNGLRRKYFEAENSIFNAVIAAAATTSSNFIASFDNIAELIKADVAALDIAKYSANGIVINKADYYTILNTEKSTGAGYGLPFGFTYENGVMRCLGVPVIKVDWIAATKYYVADWSKVEKVVTEGLSLEFSDQERFSKNEIVARIESQVGLAVKQPASIIIGDTDAV